MCVRLPLSIAVAAAVQYGLGLYRRDLDEYLILSNVMLWRQEISQTDNSKIHVLL